MASSSPAIIPPETGEEEFFCPPVCLVCSQLILKSEASDHVRDGGGPEGDQMQVDGDGAVPSAACILQGFFKIFKVKGWKKSWKLNIMEKRLPFCCGCLQQIKLIVEVKRKVKELEKVLQLHVQEVKEKIVGFESEFQSQGVYQRDKRYFHVRRSILGDTCSIPDEGLRKQQPRAVKTEFASCSKTVAVVVVSASEKAAAEKYQEEYQCPNNKTEVSDTEGWENTYEILPSSPSPSPDDILQKQSAKSTRKRRGRPSFKVSRRKRQKKNDSDEDLDWEDASYNYKPAPPKRKQRKTPPIDEDFVPDPEVGEDVDDDDGGNDDEIPEEGEENGAGDNGKKVRTYKYMRIDPTTGLCRYQNVTLEKIAEDQYKCYSCSALVPNKKELLRSHVIKFHTTFGDCKQCGMKFISVSRLNNHIKRVHKKVPIVHIMVDCRICGRPLRKTLLLRHTWTHYSEQDKADAIARGEPVPKKRPEYDCEICGHHLKTRDGYVAHKESHKAESEVLKLCPHCGKSFRQLQQHIHRVHTSADLLRFECTVCNQKFRTAGFLNLHKKRHTVDLKCHLCPRMFAFEAQLQRHINVHLNIRPFQCEHCPSAFSYKHGLARHIKIYHEEGSNPKRATFVRGPEQKTLEQRKNYKAAKAKVNNPKVDPQTSDHHGVAREDGFHADAI